MGQGIFLRFAIFALCWSALCFNAIGGVKRFDLPQLLGEYRVDDLSKFQIERNAVLGSYGYYSISLARIVVEGHATPGVARGDGNLREATQFELVPAVRAGVTSLNHIVTLFPDAGSGEFRIDRWFPSPLFPSVTPLPNPDGYPLISVGASVSIGVNDFHTAYPPLIGTPPQFMFRREGVVLETPIVVQITNAYAILEGFGVVPEPSSACLLAMLLCSAAAGRFPLRRRGADWNRRVAAELRR